MVMKSWVKLNDSDVFTGRFSTPKNSFGSGNWRADTEACCAESIADRWAAIWAERSLARRSASSSDRGGAGSARATGNTRRVATAHAMSPGLKWRAGKRGRDGSAFSDESCM